MARRDALLAIPSSVHLPDQSSFAFLPRSILSTGFQPNESELPEPFHPQLEQIRVSSLERRFGIRIPAVSLQF
jgi:hypothetical protein